MAESPPETNPTEQYRQQVMRAYEFSGHLAEVALNLAAWAEHADWSARLTGEGTITKPAVAEAFSKVKRYDFLVPETKMRAAEDRPVGIGYGQTNSQPSTVATMLGWLDPQPGQKVLDIGVGSGWSTALLAEMVGPEGAVHGTERILELVRLAKSNLGDSYPQATIHHTPKRLGLRSEAPYDRILVSAATKEQWLVQLVNQQLSGEGGIIVAPLTSEKSHGTDNYDMEILALQKNGQDIKYLQTRDGYSFVPLVLPES